MSYEIKSFTGSGSTGYHVSNDDGLIARFFGPNAHDNANIFVNALEGKPWSRAKFKSMKGMFLKTQDTVNDIEWCESEHSVALLVMNQLENFLFAEEVAKEERYQEYLKLKAEFEGEAK